MKAFFNCIALATELKKDKIRVQNVKFADKRKSQEDFTLSCKCFFTQNTDSIAVLNK